MGVTYITRLSLSVGHYELCRDDIGVLWKAPQAKPRQTLVACRCWQLSAWQTNAMQEVATFPPPQRKFANLGARRDHWVHSAGDSQAAVPFPTEIRRDIDLQWKTASSLSYLLLQLGSNGREASLPEKGATEATSCPKGGNMWRHWYGLIQAWGSTTYDWALGQILPRCREEGCQQNLTESAVKEKTRVYQHPRGAAPPHLHPQRM